MERRILAKKVTKKATRTKRKAPAADKSTVAAVDRALSVLDAFQTGGHSQTLTDLANATGMHASTILRLLATLEARNYIVRMEHGVYRLGAKLLTLGMVYQRSFRLEEYVLPVLHRLSQQTRESATLFVEDTNEALVLIRINSPQPVREDFSAGDRLPLEAGASGRTLLMFRDGVAGTPADAFAKLPIVVIGGINPDVGAVAAPVFDPAGNLVGTISISGPKSRFSAPIVDRYSKLLMTEVIGLATTIGADPDVYSNKKRATPRGPAVAAA
jgi:DNA-binding IclR family transcriptional regulator